MNIGIRFSYFFACGKHNEHNGNTKMAVSYVYDLPTVMCSAAGHLLISKEENQAFCSSWNIQINAVQIMKAQSQIADIKYVKIAWYYFAGSCFWLINCDTPYLLLLNHVSKAMKNDNIHALIYFLFTNICLNLPLYF